MAKQSTKLNDGCIRVFKFLDLLYKDEADYNRVLEIFNCESPNIDNKTTKNIHVILNKYLNTLKVFGIKVKKENGKFRIKNSYYNINFSLNDIKAIAILIEAAKNIPDEKLNNDISEFTNKLKFIMSSEDKNILDQEIGNPDLSFQYADLKSQLDECKKICEEKHNVEISYNKNGKTRMCKCTPKEIIYNPKNIILNVYAPTLMENIEIPLQDILSIKVLPQISNAIEMTTTVVFKVKGRLAKNYKLKEYEQAESIDKNGDLIVINKGEPVDKLLKRLMRYMYNCEIISPKSLRFKMKEMIENTIRKYNE